MHFKSDRWAPFRTIIWCCTIVWCRIRTAGLALRGARRPNDALVTPLTTCPFSCLPASCCCSGPGRGRAAGPGGPGDAGRRAGRSTAASTSVTRSAGAVDRGGSSRRVVCDCRPGHGHCSGWACWSSGRIEEPYRIPAPDSRHRHARGGPPRWCERVNGRRVPEGNQCLPSGDTAAAAAERGDGQGHAGGVMCGKDHTGG